MQQCKLLYRNTRRRKGRKGAYSDIRNGKGKGDNVIKSSYTDADIMLDISLQYCKVTIRTISLLEKINIGPISVEILPPSHREE